MEDMIRIVTELMNWDRQIVVDCALHRKGVLDKWMSLITLAGDGWIWLALSVYVILFDWPDGKIALIQGGLGISLEMLSYKILKSHFSRPRPFRTLDQVSSMLEPSDEFSFPSGHTAAAFVMLSVFGAAYSFLFLPLMFLAVLIGASRVYLGVHYPSDVLAGSLLGLLCGELARWLT
jgi:undecaprenyl-diphosphatase